jgi:hypothetical protein
LFRLRLTALVPLLFLPAVALANAGSTFLWASIAHLMLGNLLIGVVEGLVLRFAFQARWRAIPILILANYVSAWAGLLVLSEAGPWIGDLVMGAEPLYHVVRGTVATVAVAFALTVALEWPFVAWAFPPGARGWRKALPASLAVQAVSYAALIPYYAAFSSQPWTADPAVLAGPSVPAGSVYYQGLDGEPRIVRLDGTGDRALAPGEARKPTLERAPENARPGPEGEWVADSDDGFVNLRWVVQTPAPEPDGQPMYRVVRGVRLGIESPALQWGSRDATLLPGELAVATLGKQVVLVDLPTARVALLAQGKNPAVALDLPADATPPQVDARPAPADPGMMLTAEEIGALEARLMTEVARNRRTSCPRPVLRGPALPGRADEDVIALLTPSGELAACLDAVAARDDEVQKSLLDPTNANLLTDRAVLEQACRVLPDALSRAVRHVDACSPYLGGRHGPPSAARIRVLGHAVALLIRAAHEDGNPGRSVDLALDFARLSQDLARGEGASAEVAMTVVPATHQVVAYALGTVMNDPALPRPLLERVAREADELLGTEPPLFHLVAGQRLDLVLRSLLPVIRGPGWTPPGGFGADDEPGGQRADRARSAGDRDPAANAAMSWLALDMHQPVLAAACPAGANAAECRRGLLEAAARDVPDPLGILAGMVRTAAGAPGTSAPDAVRHEALRNVVRSLAPISAAAIARTPPRVALRSFALAALRLHAHIGLQARHPRDCPSPDALASPEWADRVRDPGSGLPMRIRETAPGWLEVRTAEVVDERWEEQGLFVYPLGCGGWVPDAPGAASGADAGRQEPR